MLYKNNKIVDLKSLLFSPLTHKVLAVNVLALVFLAFGMLYLKQHQITLFESEIDKIRSQALMIATAVGEGAVIKAPEKENKSSGTNERLKVVFLESVVKRIVKKYSKISKLKIKIYDTNIRLVGFSKNQINNSKKGIIATKTVLQKATKFFEKTSKKIFPVPNEIINNSSKTYLSENRKESEVSIKTKRHIIRIYETLEKNAGISISVPILYFNNVVGAVQVSSDTIKIEKSILDLRLKIIKIFIAILAITVIVSLYLSGSIIAPLVDMSIAAKKISKDKKRKIVFPNYKNLKNEIGQLSNSFQSMTNALWQRVDAVESFAADVSHEIKNPLSSIRSATETLETIKDPEKQKKLIQIIKEDLLRTDKIISDISDLSKLDAKISKSDYENIKILDFLNAIKSNFEQINLDKKIQIIIKNKKIEETILKAPETRLSQVFCNLIENAISFTPQNGTIKIILEKEKNKLVIFVEDEGKGITKGKEDEVFKRFYSEREKGIDKQFHSGLGLSISKTIITGIGGKIKAQNIINEKNVITGARFIVKIPIYGTDNNDYDAF